MYNKKIVGIDIKYLFIIITIVGVVSLSIYFFSDSKKDTVNSYANQILAECGNKVNCAKAFLTSISERENRGSVLATLSDLISSYEKSEVYCHVQAHHLGMFLYDYIGDLHVALSYVDQRCAGAMYHGVIQRFFMTNFEKADVVDIDIKGICPKNSDNPYSLERWECLHGIGHGLTESYNSDVLSAVQHCEDLEPGWEQISCSKGVFMENVNNYLSGGGNFDQDDPLFPCNKVNAQFVPACYNYHTGYIMAKNGISISEGFRECDKIVPEEFVKYCYFGLGRKLFAIASEDMNLALMICQLGQPKYQSYCYTGLVLIILDVKGTEQGFQYCKLLPEHNKVACYDALGKWIHMLYATDETREVECSNAEHIYYYEICVKASLEGISLL